MGTSDQAQGLGGTISKEDGQMAHYERDAPGNTTSGGKIHRSSESDTGARHTTGQQKPQETGGEKSSVQARLVTGVYCYKSQTRFPLGGTTNPQT